MIVKDEVQMSDRDKFSLNDEGSMKTQQKNDLAINTTPYLRICTIVSRFRNDGNQGHTPLLSGYLNSIFRSEGSEHQQVQGELISCVFLRCNTRGDINPILSIGLK
jgi:hypothetical protein